MDDVADHQCHDQHYHGNVQSCYLPAQAVVGKPEPPDASHVEDEGDDPDREPDRRANPRGEPGQRHEDREDHIAEQAAQRRDQDRRAEDPVG